MDFRLLSAGEHAVFEAALLERTKPGELMERAGAAVVHEIDRQDLFKEDVRALVLCGPGNNGGDGWVIARRLHEAGRPVHVWSFARTEELRGDAREAARRALTADVTFEDITDVDIFRHAIKELPVSTKQFDNNKFPTIMNGKLVVIDALLGSGVNRPIDGVLSDAVGFCNGRWTDTAGAARQKVISVDIPSGLSADSAAQPGVYVLADLTVAILSVRLAHMVEPAASAVGELACYDLEDKFVPDSEEWFDEEVDVAFQLARDDVFEKCKGGVTVLSHEGDWPHFNFSRDRKMHKGMAGRIVIVAGSAGKTGAAQLAGLAALRSGAGLVTLAVPSDCVTQVTHVPDYMTLALPANDGMVTGDGVDGLFELNPDVIALGPGLGLGDGPRRLIEQVLPKANEAGIKVVLDADALSVFAGEKSRALRGYGGSTLVITPHPGELSRLTGLSVEEIQADRVTAARRCALEWNISVVLKGFQTIIASPSDDEIEADISINLSGNPGLATGGTGDVLTGMIAAMSGRGPFACEQAVWLHGYVGDLAAAEVGETSLIASDLIRLLPQALQEARCRQFSVPSHGLKNIFRSLQYVKAGLKH